MSLNDTIAKAVLAAGTQKALAEMIGETNAHISDFKKGRPCGPKKRAHLAAIAKEDPARVVLEGVAEALSDDIPHEAEAKKGILAMLAAFPEKAWRNT